MRLYVYVLEAKDLAEEEDCFVKLRVGKCKAKTRVLKGTSNPVWNEEFVFRVRDIEEDELLVSVFQRDDDSSGILEGARRGLLLGRVRIPICSVAGEENQALPPTWFPLERRRSGKFISKVCG